MDVSVGEWEGCPIKRFESCLGTMGWRNHKVCQIYCKPLPGIAVGLPRCLGAHSRGVPRVLQDAVGSKPSW